jgi:hypothetical protein
MIVRNSGFHFSRVLALLGIALCAAAPAWCENPTDVTVCQLKADPPTYNHKLVRVTGFVSHAFEDFTLFDPKCPSWPRVWLEYGGQSKSGTTYCCGASGERSRPKELVVEDIPIPLVADEPFKNFDKAIQPPFRSGLQGAVVHATLVGRYFAGKRIKYLKGEPWGGYGHMGCCTFMAIQQILSLDTENRSQLDYAAWPDQPDVEKRGCGYQNLLSLEQTESQLKWQREADAGEHAWAFDDPLRVASTSLAKLANVDISAIGNITLKRESEGRKVYEWKTEEKNVVYLIVVSRPYVTSFYARDSNHVAWVPIAAYRSSCGGKNAVTRLK